MTLVTSSLDHPDTRKLADQLDGELANIYGGPTTGRDTNAVRLYLAAGYEMIEPYSGQYPSSRTNKGFSRPL